MILYKNKVDGYDVQVETTKLYDLGEIYEDDDEAAAHIIVEGNGHSIKVPIWAPLPKIITEHMVRVFLRERNLMPL